MNFCSWSTEHVKCWKAKKTCLLPVESADFSMWRTLIKLCHLLMKSPLNSSMATNNSISQHTNVSKEVLSISSVSGSLRWCGFKQNDSAAHSPLKCPMIQSYTWLVFYAFMIHLVTFLVAIWIIFPWWWCLAISQFGY